MRKNFILWLLCLSTCLISGCSSKMVMFISANINPLPSHTLRLSDGYVATYYSIQKGNPDITDTLLFFVGGSGHVSHNYYLESYFSQLQGNIRIYALQKPHVGHRETGVFEASEAFDRSNYYAQLVKDQAEFIRSILNRDRSVEKRVVVFGVSEGGNIAAQLAAEIQQVTHLVTLGSGGMVGIDEFRLWGKAHNIDFDRLYQEVKKHPDSITHRALGQTYKYWASMLPVDPMQSLQKLTIPILAAIGAKDEMTPPASVNYLRDEFDRLGKKNLTLKIFPDWNHVLDDSTGINHRAELLQLVSRWWEET